MLCWIAQNRRVILSLFHERWNGVMEGLTLMLSEDNPNCSFFQFLRLNGRSSGQCHLLLLLQPDSASCSCRQAPFLPYQRNLHFISLLHEMLHCVAAQRGALSPHQRQGNNQLLKLERKGITWRNATLLECFCSGVFWHRWSRALSPVTLFTLPHQLHFSKFLIPTAAPDLPFSVVLQLASTHLWKGSLEQIIWKETKRITEGNCSMLMCQIKLSLCCGSRIVSPALQRLAISPVSSLQTGAPVLPNHHTESPGPLQQ